MLFSTAAADNSRSVERGITLSDRETSGRTHADPPIGAVSGRSSSIVLMRTIGRYAAGQIMRLDR
jgi:hypothetical protein